MILVTPKRAVAKKASSLAAWYFLTLILKWIEKNVFEQGFAFSIVIFRQRVAIWLYFLLFSMFLLS